MGWFALTAWIVAVLALMVAALAWKAQRERRERHKLRSDAIRKRRPHSTIPLADAVEAHHKAVIRAAPPAGGNPSMDEMRAGMQQIAYTMVGRGVDPDKKAHFKQGMTEFASVDPLVKEIAAHARQLVADSPGILQSKVYVHFPGHNKEQVRYALYFAHELGWIYRKKKGSSYQLFPPGRVIDVPPVDSEAY